MMPHHLQVWFRLFNAMYKAAYRAPQNIKGPLQSCLWLSLEPHLSPGLPRSCQAPPYTILNHLIVQPYLPVCSWFCSSVHANSVLPSWNLFIFLPLGNTYPSFKTHLKLFFPFAIIPSECFQIELNLLS